MQTVVTHGVDVLARSQLLSSFVVSPNRFDQRLINRKLSENNRMNMPKIVHTFGEANIRMWTVISMYLCKLMMTNKLYQ